MRTLLFLLMLVSLPALSEDKVLIVSSKSNHFNSVRESLVEELGDEFLLVDFLVDKQTKPDALAEKVKSFQPKMLVLINNSSIALYRKYLELTSGQKPLPALALMSVYLDSAITGLPNITGIRYEIEGVIFLTNLRHLSMQEQAVRRVGVLYRPVLKDFIERQTRICATEKIEIVSYEIPNDPKKMVSNIRKGLNHLIKKENVDALWLLNDSALFTSDTLSRIWLSTLKSIKIPVVVGIEKWVDGTVRLGHFAVVPDHVELGAQAAGMIFEIRDNGWSTADIQVSNPVSVRKILNKDALPESFRLDKEALLDLDLVIGE